MNVTQRIEANSIPEPNSGCWIWLGRMEESGYCKTYFRGRYVGAHRVSWIAHYGDVPEGQLVLHKCDIRCCVNPDHLFVGSQQDNMDDMVAKGRHVVGAQPRGERSHLSKLNEEQARHILSSREKGSDLARAYGVSRSCISQVRNGPSWRHLR